MITEAMKQKAKSSFSAAIQDKISWIAERCWDSYTDHPTEAINTIIKAARMFGATSTNLFTEEEIKRAQAEISALKYLKMKAEIKEYLEGLLLSKGATREELGLSSLPEEAGAVEASSTE